MRLANYEPHARPYYLRNRIAVIARPLGVAFPAVRDFGNPCPSKRQARIGGEGAKRTPVYSAVGGADALKDDPAVPKDRVQGRNYTSLSRRVAQRPARPAALTNARMVRSLFRSNVCRGCPPFLCRHRQPRQRPQRGVVGRLPPLCEDGVRTRSEIDRLHTQAGAAP
ncbi:protein of unknown function (plasmid) [Aminobacter niigataensis]|nr:protein of unknown function [Aminobacter niigataensis]